MGRRPQNGNATTEQVRFALGRDRQGRLKAERVHRFEEEAGG